MSVAARVDGDHFELPSDALELLPTDAAPPARPTGGARRAASPPTARPVRWRIEQADEFREEVERYSDAERVILADAYQALLR